MDDLVRWLGEQLDADAAQARSTAEQYGAVWTLNDAMGSVSSDTGADVVDDPNTPRAYIAAHDPARVLREIDAKRQMLGRIISHATVMGWDEVHGDLLRLLAASYSDRPGYREEWRP